MKRVRIKDSYEMYKKITKLRNEGVTYKNIGLRLGMTGETARRIHKKYETR